ncbi:hypothetical protein EDF24_0407 [Curtobacterium sp. PhB130]|uniref:hypothetical protein n=1 Tax=unclassified Curtobacterium TaxID=257496 RepID=UPI000F4B6EE4|nr:MULTISPECIES: hypothetical protein [unclassified Curtobacterium]ROP63384.1 hypothetical protein EDF55_2138 [Curtobacterium sp. ZW137]ROS77648.1 hypothetical protein EDF24_0407 [Curtobacterium sp. PhB130]TCK66144.1 hypothetical protein EDF27_0896 [Curtobacterium sp. PhB136]
MSEATPKHPHGPDRDHLDDGVDMTFDERRHDTLRRMSGSDAHDEDPRVEVHEESDGTVRIDVADTAAVRPGGTDPSRRDR